MLQLGLGLGLGTGNGYFISFFFFSYLKVTNTFVLLFWADVTLKYTLILTQGFNHLRYTLYLPSTESCSNSIELQVRMKFGVVTEVLTF